ncbi:T9SS type A sorting domain-containing protein [uncultured Tenacibaculum sp.]|uniref:T9SS type A sorting domain-containing protein n=1 Tax=uncultured Tenacibaculum sp. TaxID=174713 RepID=UPI00262048EA|nr:T9SS type A sorting domain-containing protein [uncultured Tenacibaculum sp.]
MKINQTNFLFMLFLALNTITLTAQNTYYVATNGNDSNAGTASNPFKTFNKAVSVMSPGSTCIIKGGVYDEELLINKNGSAGNYITFKAADGENVTIKATKYINGWQSHSGNIYKTSVDMTIDERFRNVYHNEQHMDLARWPNNVDNNRWTVDCKFIDNGGNNFFTLTDVPDFDWTGGLVYYIGGHSGTSWTRKITSSSTTRIEHVGVDITKWPFNPHNPTILRNGHRGQLYLFNKLEALDYAREWYYDEATKTLYFQTADGSKPSDDTVEYATHKFVAEVRGDYVKIEGIKFFGGSVKIRGDYNVFENNQIIHGSEGFDNLASTTAGVGESSLEVLGGNAIVRNCTIDQSSANGISVQNWASAHNSLIEKNTISNINYLGIHATPIRVTANNVKVLKNTVVNSGRDGIYVSGNTCEVAYNDVSKAQLINADSGVFYTVGNNDLKNTEVHHNWFHDSKPPLYAGVKAAGIYLDNNSKGYVVHHNVVWNVSWSGYQVNWANWNLDFFHNTLWNCGQAMASWVNGYEQKNNRVYNNYSSTPAWFDETGFDVKDNLISTSSLLVNPGAKNFAPIETGDLVDKGVVIPGFAKSFNGTAPDLGAYEHNGTPWTAGVNAIEDAGSTLSNSDIVLAENIGVFYPNPVKDELYISFKNSVDVNNSSLEIYSMLGSKVASYSLDENNEGRKVSVPITSLSSGNYVVKIITPKGISNKVLIKE